MGMEVILGGITLLSDELTWFKNEASKWDVMLHGIALQEINQNHCRSIQDDLGRHALSYQQNIHWHFKMDLLGTTLFWCDMWWNDASGKLVSGEYDLYDFGRDYKRCQNYCHYPIRRDGVYAWFSKTQEYQLVYEWPKPETEEKGGAVAASALPASRKNLVSKRSADSKSK
ncbi:S-protein homolog 24-like [Papaver somniferum]|uniref:S-protein homolog 24-like n=1 Tax=Papaver somniferum TaxID=3469 RepID=UPI000E6FC6CC|nr:S-protein homolog 24-like [Papaver somniferum]